MVAAFRRERAGNTYGVIPAISGLIVCRVSEGLSEAILDDGRRGVLFPCRTASGRSIACGLIHSKQR